MTQYEAPEPGSKIVIVGGGCFGLSTALALASDKLKNYTVIVYDREQIPVRDAASTGKIYVYNYRYIFLFNLDRSYF